MSPALALRGITRDLRGRRVLDNLDLVVNPGECLALVGLNGAGKTTALRIALGMLRPGSGSAEVLGHDARTSGGEPWGAVGHLLELPFSYPELTARQNILASSHCTATIPGTSRITSPDSPIFSGWATGWTSRHVVCRWVPGRRSGWWRPWPTDPGCWSSTNRRTPSTRWLPPGCAGSSRI